MTEKIKQENYNNFGGINTKVSPYTTGPTQFLDIRNMDFTTPGALTQRPGSTLYVGATISGRITGGYEFVRLNGASYLIITANTNAYTATGGGYSAFKTGLGNGLLTDFVTFVDRLFVANGQDFFLYDGTTARNYSLPNGSTVGLAAGAVGTGGFTGLFVYAYGYLNDRGYLGPASGGFTVGAAGYTGIALSGFTVPTGFGITAIAVYRSSAGGVEPFFLGYMSPTSATFLDINGTPGTIPTTDAIYFTLAPKYLEIYNNQLYMAGFTTAQSSVWFSLLGEPEHVEADFNFEVRTNDGDKITGLKNYGGKLMVFKKNSFHQLTGDSVDNLLLSQVSDEYGALSNRALVVWEDYIWFLDRKGICEFNGANVKIVSTEIEPIFNTMNVTAAEENAVGVHDRQRNELKFFIPCNGATLNNCCVVYDYVSQAWSVWDVPETSSAWLATREFDSQRVFFGGYTGSVFSFGNSLMTDYSGGFTCSIKTRYHSDTGKSITQLYRRLFVDAKPILGFTAPITVNFRPDYGTSIAVTRTMYANPFQTRIDYGIPAKSLSVEFVMNSSTGPYQFYGYTIESREQRRV